MSLRKYTYILLLFAVQLCAQETMSEQRYYIDTTHSMDKKNIYSIKDTFVDIEDNTFGIKDATVWIYIRAKNTTNTLQSNILQLPYALLDRIEILKYKDEHLVSAHVTGDLTDFNTRKVKTNDFVIGYELQAYETQEIILKINSKGSLNLGINFMSEQEYNLQSKKQSMGLGVYYGAIIIMLIYNFILFLMIKDRVYFDYVLFHLVYFFLQLGMNGLMFQYVYPSSPELNAYYVPFFLILASISSVLFSVSFLEYEKYSKHLDLYFKGILYISVLVLLLVFILPYMVLIKVIASVILVSISSLFISGVYLLVKYRTSSSKFYVIAWGLFLIGISLTILQNFGLLPMNTLTLYGSQIGAFVELGLLSLALAHRYNLVFVKLSDAELDLRTLNKSLESKVVARTQDLAHKQEELVHLNNNLEVKVQKAVENTKSKERLLQEQSKLASMGEMINNIAHQWRQPLAVSNTIISIMKEKNYALNLDHDYAQVKLNELESNNLHMSQTIEDFLSFFNPKKQKEKFLLSDAIDKAISLLENSLHKENIQIDKSMQGKIVLESYPEEYVQVLISLLTNSLQAFRQQQEKKLFIRAFVVDETVKIELRDNAGGIKEEILSRVFEPYFTTKHQETGTGLGLYISKMIVESSLDGKLEVINIENGVKFTIITKNEYKGIL